MSASRLAFGGAVAIGRRRRLPARRRRLLIWSCRLLGAAVVLGNLGYLALRVLR